MGFSDAATNTPFTMPVTPMYGGGYGNGGFGFGGDGAWWLLVLLFAMNGGWGNGFGYGAGAGMPLYAMNTNNDVQRGFDQSAIMSGINGITSDLCNGFAGVTNAVNTGFASAEIANNSRQIADMQQNFAMQTAITGGMNNLQSQLAQCCCDNRLATANLNSTILSENCADRYEAANNTRDIINTINSGVQSLKDQMCQDKIDAKDDIIAQLRSELMFSRGQTSQDLQTAAIQLGQRNLANEIEQYVAPRAIPAYMVQNPNCCNNNSYSCGCNY